MPPSVQVRLSAPISWARVASHCSSTLPPNFLLPAGHRELVVGGSGYGDGGGGGAYVIHAFIQVAKFSWWAVGWMA